MAFPQTALDVLVELYYDGAWHDVTADVLSRTPITIERGRHDEGKRVDPGKCTLTFNNGASTVAPGITGRYSRRNPNSDLYGKIGRGTPVRVSVNAGSTYLSVLGDSDQASTPDTGVLDITGDIDIRIDARLDVWRAGATPIELAGKWTTTGNQRSYMLTLWADGILLYWSTDGSTLTTAGTTADLNPPPSGRMAIRATLDVDDGAGGRVATFYTAPTIDGPWTQLGDTVEVAATTSIFSGTAPLDVGAVATTAFDDPSGQIYAFQLRDGIDGTLVADADFTTQSAGAGSFVDDAGLTWTMQGDATLSNNRVRFVGEIDDWPPRWDVSGQDAWMTVVAGGILRRLGQGDGTVLQSVLRREMTADDATLPRAYWPIEDAARATTVASGLGSTAMEVNGSPHFASYSGFACSDPIVTMKAGASLNGRVPYYAATGETQVRWLCAVPSSGTTNGAVLLRVHTTGSAARWDLVYSTGGGLTLTAYDDDGASLGSSGAISFGVDGELLRVSLEFTQDGSDVDYGIVTFEVDGGADVSSHTLSSETFGRVWKVDVAPNANAADVAVGHLAVYDVITSIFDLQDQTNAWNGERAGRRIERLCAENGITLTYSGDLDATEPMGPQRSDTLLNLLEQAAAADVSAIQETRDAVGITFQPRAELYNQRVVAALTYDGDDGPVGAGLEPAEDDQYLRNKITLSRDGGSSVTYELQEGPLSVQAVPDGAGPRGGSASVNVKADVQLPDQAAWRVALGTVDEPHWPSIPVDLAAAPEAIAEVCDLDTGLRMTVSDPPEWVPPETIDQLVQGYTEVIGHPVDWDLFLNTVPCRPYLVAVRDQGGRNRQTDGSELAIGVDGDDTEFTLLTTRGLRWTDDPEDSPYDLDVAGETVTVAAPGALVNANPFVDTDASGWTGTSYSIARSTAHVHPHPRAAASLLITPDGVSATGSATATRTDTGTITPGGTYTASFWVYSPLGWSDLRPAIDWYTSADVFISSDAGSAQQAPAGQWTYLTATYTAPATASKATVRAQVGGTPAVTDLQYVWAVRITRTAASWLYDNFGRTVASSWGQADSSATWSTTGGGPASDYSVGSGYAVHVLSTVDVTRRTAVSAVHPDQDVYGSITTSALATGDSLYGAITARMADASNMYMARLEFTTSNTIILNLRKIVSGTHTSLGSYTVPATHAAGTFIRTRLQVTGSRLQAKAWPAAEREPDVWHLTATDSDITAAHQIGTRSIRVTGNTNAATVEVRYDAIEVINPQTFAVERSRNTIVKTHAAATAVTVDQPATRGL